MAHLVPTFSGYTASESMISFINNLNLYAAAQSMTPAQKGVLIQAALRGPAKVRFDAAIVATTIRPPIDAASITATITWLRTAYHTADIQQQLKDQLLVIVQEMT